MTCSKPWEEIRSAITRQLHEERELCLSPAFFHQLAAELDGVGEVRIELKRGTADNELSLFRYDVTLLIGEQTAANTPTERFTWDSLDSGLDGPVRRQEDHGGIRRRPAHGIEQIQPAAPGHAQIGDHE